MINIVKKNNKKFIFSLIANILICILFNILFYCRFHTVDDVFMEMIVCGAYGRTDIHLIFTNSIIGSFLKLLYDLTNNIPWYAILHICLSLVSFSTITYVFLNRNIKSTRTLIWLAIFFASYEAYTKIQFTKTSAYLATAGFVVISYSFEHENRRKEQILGIILLVLSSMIRTGMFLGCSAICLGCLVPKILCFIKNYKENKKNIINLCVIGTITLFLFLGSIAIDKISYSNKNWANYIEYNKYVTQLQDINFPDFNIYKDEYEKMGITYDDYLIYSSLDFNDPDNFGITTMKDVSNLQKYPPININEIYLFAIRGIRNIFEQTTTGTFTYLIILLLLFFFISKSNNRNTMASLLYTFVITCFSFTYVYYMHGWFDRTSISILFAFLITLLYLINPKIKINESRLFLICLIIMLSCVTLIWKEKLKVNQSETRNDFLHKQHIISTITADNEHLYLCKSSFSLRKNYYMAYDKIEKETCVNFQPLGDWVSNTPLAIDDLKKYDVVNPYKDIINNEKAYLIGNENDFDFIVKYIKDNFDKNVLLETVKTVDKYIVYKVISY